MPAHAYSSLPASRSTTERRVLVVSTEVNRSRVTRDNHTITTVNAQRAQWGLRAKNSAQPHVSSTV
jgi:hypothetical protein